MNGIPIFNRLFGASKLMVVLRVCEREVEDVKFFFEIRSRKKRVGSVKRIGSENSRHHEEPAVFGNGDKSTTF